MMDFKVKGWLSAVICCKIVANQYCTVKRGILEAR